LARRFAVAFQKPIDKRNRSRQFRPLPLRYLSFRRQRAFQRLPHLPPMHTKLPGHRPDRSGPMLVFPPDLLVKFHFGSPVLQIRISFRASKPETKYTDFGLQVGPNQTIERGQLRVAKSNGWVVSRRT